MATHRELDRWQDDNKYFRRLKARADRYDPHPDAGEPSMSLVLGGVDDSFERGCRAFDQAIHLLELGNPEGALRHLETALDYLPGNPETLLEKAKCLRLMNRHEDALPSFQDSLRSASNKLRPAVHYWRGRTLLEMGEYAAAEADFAALVRFLPGEKHGHFGLGLCYQWQEEYRSAITHFDECLRIWSRDVGAAYHRGRCLLQLGHPEDALRDFEAVEDSFREDAEFFHQWGLALEAVGRHDEAEDAYAAAIRIHPGEPLYWLRDARVLRRLKRPDLARRCYNTVLEMNPRNWIALAGRGKCSEDEGRHSEAVADFTSAIALYGTHAGLRLDRGVNRYRLGKIQDALADFNEAIRLDPSMAVAHDWRNRVLEEATGRA